MRKRQHNLKLHQENKVITTSRSPTSLKFNHKKKKKSLLNAQKLGGRPHSLSSSGFVPFDQSFYFLFCWLRNKLLSIWKMQNKCYNKDQIVLSITFISSISWLLHIHLFADKSWSRKTYCFLCSSLSCYKNFTALGFQLKSWNPGSNN